MDSPAAISPNPALEPLIAQITIEGDDYRLTHDFWSAALAVLVYDYLLTLDDEIKYIWGQKLTRSRVLFWVNRYWPVVNSIIYNIFLDWEHPRDSLCLFSFKWFAYTAFVSHFSIGAILVLRIYAMYACNKKILTVLLALLCIELVAEIIIITFISSQFTVLHLPSVFAGCIPTHVVSWAWAYWIPMSVFESGLFILAAAKSIKFMLYEGRQTPHLAIILLRDSMIYFGGVLALILANLITWSAGRPTLFQVFPSTVPALHSILGCRMLLNMQNAADPVTRYGETTLRTLQPLKFKQSIRSMFSRGTSTLVNEMPEEHEMDVIDIRSRQERFDITTTALSPVPEEP